MEKKPIDVMVDRFLGWKLPDDFSPDGGISFKREFNEHTAHPMKNEPVGTNLLTATQAKAMLEYVLLGVAAWSKNLPNESGYWWWWNEDGPPIPVDIEISLTNGPRYFATQGQHGWNRSQWVEDMGGYWMRLSEPQVPEDKKRETWAGCDDCC